jgi:hypothetical protein
LRYKYFINKQLIFSEANDELGIKISDFDKIVKPFRRSQRKTCLAVVAAILEAVQANSFQIAG